MGGTEKEDKSRLTIQIDDMDRESIETLVEAGEYENISVFIRQAVKEKLNPKMRRARQRKEIFDLLKDPENRAELRDLGYEIGFEVRGK